MKEFAIVICVLVLIACVAGVATCTVNNDPRSQMIWAIAALGWLVALIGIAYDPDVEKR